MRLNEGNNTAFELRKVGLGYVIDPHISYTEDFVTGDILAKFTGRLLERQVAEKEIVFPAPTFLEFLLRRKRKVTLRAFDVLTDLTKVGDYCERQYEVVNNLGRLMEIR